MSLPAGTFWSQTFQFRSTTCSRPAPVRSCELVTAIAKLVRDWIAFWASCRFAPTRSGIAHLASGATAVSAAWVGVALPTGAAGAVGVLCALSRGIDRAISLSARAFRG
jgi:hypothetical protein